MAVAVQVGPGIKPTRRRMSKLAWREALWGYAFLAPWIFGFLAFTALPIIVSLLLSFTNFDVVNPENTKFVGLEQYKLMTTDPVLQTSLITTSRYLLIAVPFGLIIPMLLATLLNSPHLRAVRLFRTLFFMPVVIPGISRILIMTGILNTDTGWLNLALGRLGIAGPEWLQDPVWIYPALNLIGLWGVGNAMLIMLAGLQGVPTELYEAARVDGANAVHSFIHVTLPMISPVLFYQLTLNVIGVFQYFTDPYVISGGTGRPNNLLMFITMYIYKQVFRYNNMGMGAAQAWLLFVLVMVCTLVLFATAKFWVYYAGSREE